MKIRRYLEYVRSLHCCRCGKPGPNEAHHLIDVGASGLGMKCCDLMTIPLCGACHRHLHDKGGTSFTKLQIDCLDQTLLFALNKGVIQIKGTHIT